MQTSGKPVPRADDEFHLHVFVVHSFLGVRPLRNGNLGRYIGDGERMELRRVPEWRCNRDAEVHVLPGTPVKQPRAAQGDRDTKSVR